MRPSLVWYHHDMAHSTLLTYDDLQRFPEDNVQREIIGGVLFVSPSATGSHQVAVLVIAGFFREHAMAHGGWAYASPRDAVFTIHDVVEPDVIYIAADRLEIIDEQKLTGAPTIVVEVLSPSTSSRDRRLKLELYAKHSV